MEPRQCEGVEPQPIQVDESDEHQPASSAGIFPPMARYNRRGHYRRSPNGGYHYVRPHSVNRSSWSWWSGNAAAPPSTWFHPLPATPNATCPICGARVFYWQNASGAKVWFDALGWPWPKHPCLDFAQVKRGPVQTTNGMQALTTAGITTARSNAEGPLPPRRLVTGSSTSNPDTAGCLGCLSLLGIVLLVVVLFSGVASLATGEAFDDELARMFVYGLTFSTIGIGGLRLLKRRPGAGLSNEQRSYDREHPPKDQG